MSCQLSAPLTLVETKDERERESGWRWSVVGGRLRLAAALEPWLLTSACRYTRGVDSAVFDALDISDLPGWLIAIIFAGGWAASSLVLSLVGGWHRMPARYRARERPPGQLLFAMYSAVGWVRYQGVLFVRVTEPGLYLSVLLPFRIGHPPLLIPWSEIQAVERRTFFIVESHIITVGSPQIARIKIGGCDGNAVETAWRTHTE